MSEQKSLARPVSEQIAEMAIHIVENTRERPKKNIAEQKAEQSEVANEKPQQQTKAVETPKVETQAQQQDKQDTPVMFDSNGNGYLFDDDIRIQHITKNNQKDILPKTAVLDIADPDKEKMQLSAETLKLSGGKIPSDLKILKQDYLEKCSFLPPMKISDGKAHIYVDESSLADEIRAKMPIEAIAAKKSGTAEIVISERLAGSMIKAGILISIMEKKEAPFPSIQGATDEYARGLRKTFPNITDDETTRLYKEAYKSVSSNMDVRAIARQRKAGFER